MSARWAIPAQKKKSRKIYPVSVTRIGDFTNKQEERMLRRRTFKRQLIWYKTWTHDESTVYAVQSHHQHHQSLNREGRWGTTDDFATSFLPFYSMEKME